MKHLLLLSNHLNKRYIDHFNPDITTMITSDEQFTFFKYHQFRIIYHLSAMMHFKEKEKLILKHETTWYKTLKDLPKDRTYYIYDPNDFWLKDILENHFKLLSLKVVWLKDINFFFEDIEKEMTDPPYKLDPLYRKWRKRYNILMKDGKPIGGSFSYDSKNRNTPPSTLEIEEPLSFEPDEITKNVIEYVEKHFKNHPKSDKVFPYPVTKEDANKLLEHFIEKRLDDFGVYQDAMMENHPFMVHSMLSTSINLGLLFAKDVVKKVEYAYFAKNKPIEAVEGFIRQVLGWREYIRGIYLKTMTRNYHKENHFNHQVQKPQFLYDAKTDLNCLHQTIKETINHGYNHHIQRLMIIGNITNMMEIKPVYIREWFNEMYMDSFDYIVTPNVIGMAMYADGGLMSTKPYISSANYINKMSNYCANCKYDPKKKTGEDACPINALYYNFLDKNKDKLESNPRMKFMYINYHKLDNTVLLKMKDKAKETIENIK